MDGGGTSQLDDKMQFDIFFLQISNFIITKSGTLGQRGREKEYYIKKGKR